MVWGVPVFVNTIEGIAEKNIRSRLIPFTIHLSTTQPNFKFQRARTLSQKCDKQKHTHKQRFVQRRARRARRKLAQPYLLLDRISITVPTIERVEDVKSTIQLLCYYEKKRKRSCPQRQYISCLRPVTDAPRMRNFTF